MSGTLKVVAFKVALGSASERKDILHKNQNLFESVSRNSDQIPLKIAARQVSGFFL